MCMLEGGGRRGRLAPHGECAVFQHAFPLHQLQATMHRTAGPAALGLARPLLACLCSVGFSTRACPVLDLISQCPPPRLHEGQTV